MLSHLRGPGSKRSYQILEEQYLTKRSYLYQSQGSKRNHHSGGQGLQRLSIKDQDDDFFLLFNVIIKKKMYF